MKLNEDPRIPVNPTASIEWLTRLSFQLTSLFRDVSRQVNSLSQGSIAASFSAYTAAPTTGLWAQGDYIRNSGPTEGGSLLSKYVVLGWVCTVGGTPGTWLECRALTGN
jgi:hypothetical protein